MLLSACVISSVSSVRASVAFKDGWNLFYAAQAGSLRDSRVRALWHWDEGVERYTELPLETSLLPGGVYFAYIDVPGSVTVAEASALRAQQLEGEAVSVSTQLQSSEGVYSANRRQALALRDALRKRVPSARLKWVQTEYQARGDGGGLPRDGSQDGAGSELRSGILEGGAGNDERFLAGFQRAWVYTQGLALHQAVRRGEGEVAEGLARWLCDPANVVWSGDRILGWPFSQNTQGDTWRDARLVTGATAWAIHGLGTFLVSDGFLGLEQEDQIHFRVCYRAALKGLETHRVMVGVADKKVQEGSSSACGQAACAQLMTAGWTTQGLQHATEPWRLGLAEDHGEQWAYYDVLDALGYHHFDETKPLLVRRMRGDSQGPGVEDEVFALSKHQFETLRVRTQAKNVVTEHNLDVLSVLNHALQNEERLWPEVEASKREALHGWLEAWRDGVRRGIFELLWDAPKGGLPVEEKAPNGCRTKPKHVYGQGRVITGGHFDERGRFFVNREVAIDNCSWLALSVDYDELPRARVDQLEQCLEYTIQKFADAMPSGPENECYYGTHYFPNSFRDRYIERSGLQEVSYHLEATAGLILGLERFRQAHPDRGRAFEHEARTLWSGVQRFVQDYGFPYSSQRIQDLSTQLSSSTAAIWYLDVDDAFHEALTLKTSALLTSMEVPNQVQPVQFMGAQEQSSPDPWAGWPFSYAFAVSDVSESHSFSISTGFAPPPEAVAQNVLATEFAKQLGLREALKFALIEIIHVATLGGFVAEFHASEVDAMVDQVFVEEKHNVVVVDEGVSLGVPPTFEFLGWEPLPAEWTAKEIYQWPVAAMSRYPHAWEKYFSLGIVDSVVLGASPELRALAADIVRPHIQGLIPQNVVLKRVGRGVEIYRKANLDFSWEGPRGVVLHLGVGQPEPELIHQQPGPWAQWYQENVLATDIAEPHRQAYLKAVNQWILDRVLVSEKRTFKEASEEAKEKITGMGAQNSSGGGGPKDLSGGSVPRPNDLPELERKLDYRFKNRLLLEYALNPNTEEFETLEYLGDGVLETFTWRYVKRRFPDKSYDELEYLKKRIVSNASLVLSGQRLGLDKLVSVDPAHRQYLAANPKGLADVFEALVAAMYWDAGGDEEALRVVEERIHPWYVLPPVALGLEVQWAVFEEWAHEEYGASAQVRHVETQSPDGQVTSEVLVDKQVLGQATGGAPQDAYRSALEEVYQAHGVLLQRMFARMQGGPPLKPLSAYFPIPEGPPLSSVEEEIAASFTHLIPEPRLFAYVLRYGAHVDRNQELRSIGSAVLDLVNRDHMVSQFSESHQIKRTRAFSDWIPEIAFKLGLAKAADRSSPPLQYHLALRHTFRSFVGLLFVVRGFEVAESFIKPLLRHSRGIEGIWNAQSPTHLRLSLWALEKYGQDLEYRTRGDAGVFVTEIRSPKMELVGTGEGPSRVVSRIEAIRDAIVRNSIPGKELQHGDDWGTEPLPDSWHERHSLDITQLLLPQEFRSTLPAGLGGAIEGPGTLLDVLGDDFEEDEAFAHALTHPSFSAESRFPQLTFLGKSTLKMLGAHVTLERFPQEAKKSTLEQRWLEVQGSPSLVSGARALELGKLLRLKPNPPVGIRKDPDLLAEAMASVIGWMHYHTEGHLGLVKNRLEPLLTASQTKEGAGSFASVDLNAQFPVLENVWFSEPELEVMEQLPIALPNPSDFAYLVHKADQPFGNERLHFLGKFVIDLVSDERCVRGYPGGPVAELLRKRDLLDSNLAYIAWQFGLSNVLKTSAPDVGFADGLRYTLRTLMGLVYVRFGLSAVRSMLWPRMRIVQYPNQIRNPESPESLRLALWSFDRYGVEPIYKTTAAGSGYEVTIFALEELVATARADDVELAKQGAIHDALDAHSIP